MAHESKHQQAVIKWTQQPAVRSQWPELALLYHIKNEDKESAKQVAIDKAMGVKKGVPDFCLPVPRGKYHGLYIEMKNETGHTNRSQEWWGEHLTAQGYCWRVCHGWEAAVDVLTTYLQLEGANYAE